MRKKSSVEPKRLTTNIRRYNIHKHRRKGNALNQNGGANCGIDFGCAKIRNW